MINISKEDANLLLEEAAELIITLRSWGFHLESNPHLKFRDADTGKQLGGWSGEALNNLIHKIRQRAIMDVTLIKEQVKMSNNTDRVLYRNSITILSNEPVLLHDIFDENFGSYFRDFDFKWIGDVGLDNENVEVTEFTDQIRSIWDESYATDEEVVEVPKVLYRSTFSFIGNDYVNTYEMLDDHIDSYVSDDFKWIGCPETSDLDNVEVSFDYLKNTKYDNGESLIEVWNEMHGDEEAEG